MSITPTKHTKTFWTINSSIEVNIIDDFFNGDYCYSEGALIYRKHLIRERNPKLVRAAKAQAKERIGGKLVCEACGFNFKDVYGNIGEDFIEAHHKTPLSNIEKINETKIDELVMLCANCHRMIHKNKDMTVEQLKAKLKKQ